MAFKKSGFWALGRGCEPFGRDLGFGTTDVDGEHIAYSMLPCQRWGEGGCETSKREVSRGINKK